MAIMEKMTQANATAANLLTNFTPQYTMTPVEGREMELEQ